MHANLPDIANRWEAKYGLGGIAELNSQLNSLPEYYLPKNQGGLIPAHEAGIYGLADGGQLVQPGPGRPGYNGQGDYTPDRSSDRGPRDDPDRFGPTTETETKTTTTDGVYQDRIMDIAKRKGYDTKTIVPHEGPDPEGDWKIKTKTIKQPDEDKDWVSPTLDKIDAGLKLKNFATTLNPVDLLKVNPVLLGGSFLYNKFKNKKGDTTSINFGEGLVDQFEGIEGQTADLSVNDIRMIQKAKKYGLTTLTEIKETIGAGFNKKNPPTDEEIKGVLEGTITEPTGIFAAEGGIAGLKHGGAIAGGHQIGTPIGNRTGFGNPFGYSDDPVETSSSTETTTGNNFDYGKDQEEDVAKMMSDMGITPDHSPDYSGDRGWVPSEDEETEIGGADYIGPKDQVRIQNDILNRKKKYDSLWASTKRGYKTLKSIPKPTGVLWVDIPRMGYFMYQQNKLKKERIAEIDSDLSLLDKTGATKFTPHTDTIYQQLEQEKLDLLQPKKRPDEAPDGGDGITGIASITYDDMEGYNEKVRASTEWSQEQKKVDRSKQDAYYAAFRQKYLMGDTEESQLMPVAQGGRIPGYNTGGLSNLFRLKNV